MYLVMAAINKLEESQEYRPNIPSTEALSEYLGSVENGRSFHELPGDRGVGTFGGSEDHAAILCCQPGNLSEFAFGPARLQRQIPLPQELILGVASSGVQAEKTRHAMELYNRASRLAAAVVEAWNHASGKSYSTIGEALAGAGKSTAAQIRRVLAGLPNGPFTAEELVRRFDHFCRENEQILPAAVEALMAGDAPKFGELTQQSQQGAEELLGNQVPQTIFLARAARQCGALAASSFGAGFGGSVWALFERASASEQLDAWRDAYCREYADLAPHANFFLTRPGRAAFELA
jgi:galactokinase